jgi:hypothetical protein
MKTRLPVSLYLTLDLPKHRLLVVSKIHRLEQSGTLSKHRQNKLTKLKAKRFRVKAKSNFLG